MPSPTQANQLADELLAQARSDVEMSASSLQCVGAGPASSGCITS